MQSVFSGLLNYSSDGEFLNMPKVTDSLLKNNGRRWPPKQVGNKGTSVAGTSLKRDPKLTQVYQEIERAKGALRNKVDDAINSQTGEDISSMIKKADELHIQAEIFTKSYQNNVKENQPNNNNWCCGIFSCFTHEKKDTELEALSDSDNYGFS